MISLPRPSLLFAALPLPCIILNANQRAKTGELGLGTRLSLSLYEAIILQHFDDTPSKNRKLQPQSL